MCSEAAIGRKTTERAKTILLFLKRNCAVQGDISRCKEEELCLLLSKLLMKEKLAFLEQ